MQKRVLLNILIDTYVNHLRNSCKFYYFNRVINFLFYVKHAFLIYNIIIYININRIC